MMGAYATSRDTARLLEVFGVDQHGVVGRGAVRLRLRLRAGQLPTLTALYRPEPGKERLERLVLTLLPAPHQDAAAWLRSIVNAAGLGSALRADVVFDRARIAVVRSTTALRLEQLEALVGAMAPVEVV